MGAGGNRKVSAMQRYSCPDATHGRVGYAKRGRLAGAGQWWSDVWGGPVSDVAAASTRMPGWARRQRSAGHVGRQASIGQRGSTRDCCLRWRYLPSQRDGLCRRDACPRSLPPLALSPEPARWPLPTRRLSSVAQFSNFIQVHALVTNRNYAR
jgi:hypothetical protein